MYSPEIKMNDLLAQNYYQNTLREWLIGLGIIVGSVMLGRAVYWIFSKIVRAFTSRSKIDLDDQLSPIISKG